MKYTKMVPFLAHPVYKPFLSMWQFVLRYDFTMRHKNADFVQLF